MKTSHGGTDRKRNVAKLVWSFAVAVAVTVVGLRYFRRKFDAEVARISELLKLAPGTTVTEVGAGKGEMTVRIARLVQPGGGVLSTEFDPKRLARVRRLVKKAGADNVTVLRGSESGAELPAESCDAIMMRVVYHHFTAPREMNRSLLRALRPGGTLAVIDFPPRPLLSLWTPKGIPDNRGGHGIRKDLLVKELSDAGFQKVRELDDWPSRSYCVVFRKPAAA
jgi:ubiquinone/menaquinone biosynthesis C-methylase UbiE